MSHLDPGHEGQQPNWFSGLLLVSGLAIALSVLLGVMGHRYWAVSVLVASTLGQYGWIKYVTRNDP